MEFNQFVLEQVQKLQAGEAQIIELPPTAKGIVRAVRVIPIRSARTGRIVRYVVSKQV